MVAAAVLKGLLARPAAQLCTRCVRWAEGGGCTDQRARHQYPTIPWKGRCTTLHCAASLTQLHYAPLAGKLLVRWYGEHSSSWVAPKHVSPWDEAGAAAQLEALSRWGKRAGRGRLVAATLAELAARSDSREEEVARMARLGRTYQLDALQAAARARAALMLRPAAAGASTAAGNMTHVARPLAGPVRGNAYGVCNACDEEVPNVRCGDCRAWLHSLCCSPPALTPSDWPGGQRWTCPVCDAENEARVLSEAELLQNSDGSGANAERMGLTPDWIIATGAFDIFQLEVRTPIAVRRCMAPYPSLH